MTRVVKVQMLVSEQELKRDLKFSPNDLTDAMVQQSALFAHYGVLYAKAERQVGQIKLLLENAEAVVYRKLRDNAETDEKKITETQLERLISRHPQIIEFKKAINEAKQIESVAKIAVESFRHRRDMLIQQGLISREEMKGEVSISRRRETENVVNDQRQGILDRMKDLTKQGE